MTVLKRLTEVVISLIVHVMVLALRDLKGTSTASRSCSLPPAGGNVLSRSLDAWPIQLVACGRVQPRDNLRIPSITNLIYD